MKKGVFIAPILIICFIIIVTSFSLQLSKIQNLYSYGIIKNEELQYEIFDKQTINIEKKISNLTKILNDAKITTNFSKLKQKYIFVNYTEDKNLTINGEKIYYPLLRFIELNDLFNISYVKADNCEDIYSNLNNYLESLPNDVVWEYKNFECYDNKNATFTIIIKKGLLSFAFPYELNNGNSFFIDLN